jgi:hypothetical protein
MATERWSNEFLDEMRKKADPVGDALIEDTYRTQGLAGLTLLNEFLQNIGKPPDLNDLKALLQNTGTAADGKRLKALNALLQPGEWPPSPYLTEGVQRFFNDPVEYPDWVDWDRIGEADKLFRQHPFETLLVLFLRSFPQVFANTSAALAFYQMDIFKPGSLKRFMIETAQLIVDVVFPLNLKPVKYPGIPWGPGKFIRNGFGVIALQKLRLHHSLTRFRLHPPEGVPSKGEPWDTATAGEPINQEDMAFGVLAFAIWNLGGFEKLHLELTEEEQEATLMLWKVCGFLLGLEEDLQVANVAEGKQLLKEIVRRQARSSKEGISLVRQLLDVADSFLPPCLHGLPALFARFLMDPVFVVMLKVPRPRGLASKVVRFLGLAAHELSPLLARRFVLGLQAERKDREGRPLAFRLPEALAQRLFAPPMTSDAASEEPASGLPSA